MFAFWREGAGESIYIGSPGPAGSFGYHTCVANTYSNYKITVSPDETDDSKSVVELMIDGVLVSSLTYNKVK